MLSGTPSTSNPELAAAPTLVAAIERARRTAASPIQELSGDGTIPTPGDGDIVAAAVLWTPNWDEGALRALLAGLEGRRLVFVEPTAGLGWRRLLQRLSARWWLYRFGHAFDRDVVAELRATGFVIITVDRFALGPLRLRTYAFGEAIAPARGPQLRSR